MEGMGIPKHIKNQAKNQLYDFDLFESVGFFIAKRLFGTLQVQEQINFTISICSKVLVFHREKITWHPPNPRANQLYDFDLLESVGFS